MRYNPDEWKKRIEDVIAAGPYTDTWESLSEHETPRWFRDAKFGIFIHWGLYSVRAFGSEWYSRNMYVEGSPEFAHHRAIYGLQKNFGYKDFIPLFGAEHFDPAAWAELFEKAGAKFVVPVAEHHDGFQMYRSELSEWNAYEKGPRRDLVPELTEALRERGLITGASSHRIEHWWFMSPGTRPLPDGTPAGEWSDIPEEICGKDIPESYVCEEQDAGDKNIAANKVDNNWAAENPHMNHGRDMEGWIGKEGKSSSFYGPAVCPDPENFDDRYGTPAPSEEFLNDWMFRTVEIIDRMQPQELYFDWWVHQAAVKPYMRKVLAYYYNRGVEWDKEVMAITKDNGIPYGCAVPDVERGGFSTVQPESWQTDTAIGKNSWGYTKDNVYKDAGVILLDLIDAVSRNGTMLLNVGPRPDGTITEEDTKVLLEIGDWLQTNGEAVYGSRPWWISGEGPTKVKTGAFADQTDTAYTAEDFRFTINHGHLYVFAMNYPDPEGHGANGRYSEIRVKSLPGKAHPAAYEFGQLVKGVDVLGFDEQPEWFQTEDEMVIRTHGIRSTKPVVFRVNFV